MTRRFCVLAAFLFFVCLSAEVAAQSQATSAEINGRVTDAQGGTLPGVTVTIASAATGYTRSVVTNADGLYSAPLLPPGTYTATYELAGFQTVTHPDIVVTVGATRTIAVTLPLSGVEENLTVTATTPLVESTAAVRTSTITTDAIANLPINGRRFQDFVTLTPTVQVDPSRGQLSFSGQRGINANISVDGADFNQPFFGGIRGGERSNNAFVVPQEAIQEFQVVAAGSSAEFGRSSGGVVNAITKSGTNQLRGSAFYVNRHRDLAEKNAFDQAAAPTQQQFGGSIGGPLKRDRLFFFGAYEQQIVKNPRHVFFDRLAPGVYTPTPATQAAYDFFKSLETDFEATNDAQTPLARIDYQIDSANRLSVRYSHSSNNALNANATGNALDANTVSALSNNGTEKDRTDVLVGEYTNVMSGGLLLETRGQYAREVRPREANALEPALEGAVGRFGTVSFLPNEQSDWRAQVAANLTALRGSHTVKVGVEYNHVYADQTFGFNQFGRFLLSGTNTDTLLDLMSPGGNIPNAYDTSDVTYLRQLGNLQVDLATDELAFFAQDSWRVRPNLTINYGLRWEGSYNPQPPANNDFLVSLLRGTTFPSGTTTDPTQIPNQTNQWGPRLGFAWDPGSDGRTVVRGYSGLYYARTPGLLYTSPLNNFRVPPGDLSLQLPFIVPGNPNNTVYKQLLLIGVDLNTLPTGTLPALTVEQMTQIAAALGLEVNPYLAAQPLVMDSNFRNPRATHFGLGIEREVMPGLTLGVEGSVIKTDFLQRNRDVNLSPPTIREGDVAQRPYFGLTTGTPRPINSLGSVQVRESSASSNYRALVFTSRLQRPWGQVNAGYVLSKSESDDDNERDSGGALYENAYDLSPEWGPARLDRRHQFNGFVLLHLPWSFDLSSGFRFLSGRPIDATLGTDANGDRVNTDRPFSAPGQPFQRNIFRNEPFKEVTLRVQWGLPMASRQRVTLSAEIFNLFNWDNIELSGTPVTNYCAAPIPADCGFGAPTNPNFLALRDAQGNLLRNNLPGAPRQIQLGVRYQF